MATIDYAKLKKLKDQELLTAMTGLRVTNEVIHQLNQALQTLGLMNAFDPQVMLTLEAKYERNLTMIREIENELNHRAQKILTSILIYDVSEPKPGVIPPGGSDEIYKE